LGGATASSCLAKRHDTAPSDHFEKAFLVRRPHVAAIQPHRHRSIRQVHLGIHFGFHRIGLSFFAQLCLHPLGDGLQMFTHCFVIGGLANRQYFFQ
jgi:hypothetical protein